MLLTTPSILQNLHVSVHTAKMGLLTEPVATTDYMFMNTKSMSTLTIVKQWQETTPRHKQHQVDMYLNSIIKSDPTQPWQCPNNGGLVNVDEKKAEKETCNNGTQRCSSGGIWTHDTHIVVMLLPRQLSWLGRITYTNQDKATSKAFTPRYTLYAPRSQVDLQMVPLQ